MWSNFRPHLVHICMNLINLFKKFDLSQFLFCPRTFSLKTLEVKSNLQKYVNKYMYC